MAMQKKHDSNATIKRTGELMLAGWKLLSQVCPICSSPLLSNKSHQMRCPGCDMPVMLEADVVSSEMKVNNGRGGNVLLGENGEEAEDEYDQVDEPRSFEEMKKEYDAKHKDREKISSRLGERMLSGWTLLGGTPTHSTHNANEHERKTHQLSKHEKQTKKTCTKSPLIIVSCLGKACEGTPLMSKASDPDKMICVGCDVLYTYSSFNELVPLSAEGKQLHQSQYDNASAVSKTNQQKAQGGGTSPSSSSSILSRFDLSDVPILNFAKPAEGDASSRISDKLLKGWAMLEEVCVEGHCKGAVPLMRDLEGVKRCVQCGHVSGQPKGKSTTPPSAVADVVVGKAGQVQTQLKNSKYAKDVVEEDEDENEEEDGEDEEDEEEAAAYSRYARNRFASLAQKAASAIEVQVKSKTSQAAPTIASFASVKSILTNKLHEAAQELNQSSSFEAISKASDVILKLACALKAVNEI